VSRNVEIKARLAEPAAFRARVEELADEGPILLEQDDTFFHSRRGRLKLRKQGGGSELIYYERTDLTGPAESQYFTESFEDPATIEAMLSVALEIREQQVQEDGNVLVPFLFSEAVNLHPVAIILAVLFFGGIWGLWGVFFAIPLATLIKAIINAWPTQVLLADKVEVEALTPGRHITNRVHQFMIDWSIVGCGSHPSEASLKK